VSVYWLSRTVVPHLLQANCRLTTIEGPPQAIACGPHFRQGFHYYSLIMFVGLQSGKPVCVAFVLNTCGESSSGAFGVGRRLTSRRTASRRTTSRRRTTARRTISRRTTSRRKRTSHRKTSHRTCCPWPHEDVLARAHHRKGSLHRSEEKVFAAKTNLESLLLERLLLHLCELARAYHRKGSLHRLCGERVLLRVIDTLGWGSCLLLKKEYTHNLHAHRHTQTYTDTHT